MDETPEQTHEAMVAYVGNPSEVEVTITRKEKGQTREGVLVVAHIYPNPHGAGGYVYTIREMEETGNPKAVQDRLRHQVARMTLRYL